MVSAVLMRIHKGHANPNTKTYCARSGPTQLKNSSVFPAFLAVVMRKLQSNIDLVRSAAWVHCKLLTWRAELALEAQRTLTHKLMRGCWGKLKKTATTIVAWRNELAACARFWSYRNQKMSKAGHANLSQWVLHRITDKICTSSYILFSTFLNWRESEIMS